MSFIGIIYQNLPRIFKHRLIPINLPTRIYHNLPTHNLLPMEEQTYFGSKGAKKLTKGVPIELTHDTKASAFKSAR